MTATATPAALRPQPGGFAVAAPGRTVPPAAADSVLHPHRNPGTFGLAVTMARPRADPAPWLADG